MMRSTVKPLKLLLIDDDPFTYLFIREQLAQLDESLYQIDWRDDFEGGLKALQAQRHDVYLIDYHLGDQDGLALLRENQYLGRDTAAILLTSTHSHELYLRSLELGASGYLTKQEITASLLERSIRHAVRYAQALDALRTTEVRYRAVAESAEVGVWEWDRNLHLASYSPRWKSLLSHSHDDIGSGIGEWFERLHPEERQALMDELHAHLDGHLPAFRREHRMRCADGGYRWFLSQGVAVSRGRIAGTMTDIHHRKQAEEQIRYNATHDALTGLPNRTYFMEALTRQFQDYMAMPVSGFTVMFIDLNGFKLVNDSLGHLLGDQLLATMAQRLRDVCDDEFQVARIGGDEFALLMPGVADPELATEQARRIHRSLCQPVSLAGRELGLGASIGIAVSDARYARPEDLLRDADLAMYQAKNADDEISISVFHPRLHAAISDRLRLENEFRKALENRDFILHYQPIYSLASERVVAVEALVRWRHEDRGWISPEEFIPFAEEAGLIVPLGEWVLEEACQQLATWRSLLPGGRDLQMSINISPRQFVSPQLPDLIVHQLQRFGLPADSLKLEITESALLPDAAELRRQLGRLQELGIHCMIDDFGTGYSPLSDLHQLPGTGLKIDRSFVRDLRPESKQAAIVQAIVTLGKQLGMEVIAEGVENLEQLTVLQEMGCELIQGFWYAGPMPTNQLQKLLQTARSNEGLATAQRSAA